MESKQRRAAMPLTMSLALYILMVFIMGLKPVEADGSTPDPGPPPPTGPQANDKDLCLKCTQTMPAGTGDQAPPVPGSSYGNCFSPPPVNSEGAFTYNRTEDYCTAKTCFVETKGATVTRGCDSRPGAAKCPMDTSGEQVTYSRNNTEHTRVCECTADVKDGKGGCNTFTVREYHPPGPVVDPPKDPDDDGAGSLLGITFQFSSLLAISLVTRMVYNCMLQ